MSVNIVRGNALALPLASGVVQTVVTSPPYWSLRDYGIEGQLGLEPVPDCLGWATGAACGECFVCHMVQVFREVRRVLRDDGVCFLNLGDSYGHGTDAERQQSRTSTKVSSAQHAAQGGRHGGMAKQLLGIPWRVAFALQADGWYLRSDIIWSKPNPMPESVTDRPTKAHEYVFLLAKSGRYYYDAEAVKEPNSETSHTGGQYRNEWKYAEIKNTNKSAMRVGVPIPRNGRNRRTVWNIATQPYSGAHFATFPEKLVEPCILAGTSERGCCPHCGAPWARVVEREGYDKEGWGAAKKDHTGNLLGSQSMARDGNGRAGSVRVETTGWSPTCACPPHEPRPCLVLDPFSGSGTVGRVAVKHRRRFVGTDLNPEYIALAGERTSNVQIMLGVGA